MNCTGMKYGKIVQGDHTAFNTSCSEDKQLMKKEFFATKESKQYIQLNPK